MSSIDGLGTDSGQSLTHLVSGIVTDTQELMKQQWQLLRHEVREDVRKTKEASAALVLGAALVAAGSLLLCHLLVYFVSWLMPTWPLWVCFGIVGLPIVLVGIALLFAAFNKLKSLNPLPDESAQALKENVRWITKPK